MRLSCHCEIEKDLKKLKRFPAPIESLEAWKRLFCLKGLKETPGIKQYPGFGQGKIFKARVVPLKEKCGKSDGYRLIFKAVANDSYEIIVFSRHGIYKHERELMKKIKDRS
ncbi:hypothetical protein KJ969_01730 [Patescibacteria group bacterium]|nr:hypothetical protein [Patescibacteria group bacterium]MBU1921791.1 hypothetical protein [Patescibacteria group bacterium]